MSTRHTLLAALAWAAAGAASVQTVSFSPFAFSSQVRGWGRWPAWRCGGVARGAGRA